MHCILIHLFAGFLFRRAPLFFYVEWARLMNSSSLIFTKPILREKGVCHSSLLCLCSAYVINEEKLNSCAVSCEWKGRNPSPPPSKCIKTNYIFSNKKYIVYASKRGGTRTPPCLLPENFAGSIRRSKKAIILCG